jgi:hypothetical protein
MGSVGRVPVVRRADNVLKGLVARRDLLRVRSDAIRHEREREKMIHWRRTPAEMKI